MIGIVIVSHSQALAEAAIELAQGLGETPARMVAAGGVDDPDNPIGTDATRVLSAIKELGDQDGILVLMDLGSAVMSAEVALDLLDDELRSKVRLSAAPLVEAAVVASAMAGTGADLDEVIAEAERALDGKVTQLSESEATDNHEPAISEHGRMEIEIDITPDNGLHARPAVRFVKMASGFESTIEATNLTNRKGPVNAASMVAVATLGAAKGHRVRLTAEGPDAEDALEALYNLAQKNFGD